jgi:hypothetical protein
VIKSFVWRLLSCYLYVVWDVVRCLGYGLNIMHDGRSGEDSTMW